MSTTVKTVIWIVVIAVVAWIGYAVVNKNDNAAIMTDSGSGPIKIGVLQSLSGDAASLGTPQRKAVELAVEKINAAGGINGRQITLIVEDDKCDPQAGGTAAEKLVNVDKVIAIVGGTCSGATIAAAAVTEPAGVILISGSATSPKITTAGDHVFRVIASDALAGRVAARYNYEKLGARKAAILSELTDYSQGLRGSFKEGFTALGGQIVADETYTTSATDFRTQLTKIKAANPDVIYIVPQTPTPGVAIVKQAKEGGITVPIQTAEVLMDRGTVTANKAVLEGVYGVEVSVDYEKNAVAKAFKEAYRAKFNEDPGAYANNSYDAMVLLGEALKTSKGKINTDEARDFLYKVKAWEGTVGPITMDSNGDPLLGLNVRQVKGGAVTDMGPFNP